jgi:hypothetical protein
MAVEGRMAPYEKGLGVSGRAGEEGGKRGKSMEKG